MRSLSPEILKYDRNNDEEEFGCVAKCWIKVAQQIIPRLVCSLPMTAAVSTDRSILLKNSQRASIRAMLKSLLIFVVVIISLLSVFQYFIFTSVPLTMDVLALHCIAPQWEAPGWNPIWPPMETNEVGLSHSGLGFYIYFPPVHRPPPSSSLKKRFSKDRK